MFHSNTLLLVLSLLSEHLTNSGTRGGSALASSAFVVTFGAKVECVIMASAAVCSKGSWSAYLLNESTFDDARGCWGR